MENVVVENNTQSKRDTLFMLLDENDEDEGSSHPPLS